MRRDLIDLTLAIAASSGAAEALDTTTNIIQREAIGSIPDDPFFRKALETWGIHFTEGGEPIGQLVGSIPTLSVTLPEGWEVKYIGNGHNNLIDDKGAIRLWWHVHGWDPIATDVRHRYNVVTKDLGPKHIVVQVLDRDTSLQAFPVELPHSRDDITTYEGGKTYYKLVAPEDRFDTAQMEALRKRYVANDTVLEGARTLAKKWLDENRPGHLSAIQSWVIEGK